LGQYGAFGKARDVEVPKILTFNVTLVIGFKLNFELFATFIHYSLGNLKSDVFTATAS
jgi:hypothetical protein